MNFSHKILCHCRYNSIMANLGNDDLEEEVMEEVDADQVLGDFEYLPVKTEFPGASHAVCFS